MNRETDDTGFRSNCSELHILFDKSTIAMLKEDEVTGSDGKKYRRVYFSSPDESKKLCVALNASDEKRYYLTLTVAASCGDLNPNEIVAVRKHAVKPI